MANRDDGPNYEYAELEEAFLEEFGNVKCSLHLVISEASFVVEALQSYIRATANGSVEGYSDPRVVEAKRILREKVNKRMERVLQIEQIKKQRRNV